MYECCLWQVVLNELQEGNVTYLFQHLHTTHFSPAFNAMVVTTFGDSRSMSLLNLSPVGAAGASVAADNALTLIHLELLDLNAFAMRVETASSTTIAKNWRIVNIADN